MATLYTTLADVVGSPVKQAASGNVRALSCTHSVSLDQTDTPLMPLLPFLVQRPCDLKGALAGVDPESEEGSDQGLKVCDLLPG